ncbi:MAG: 23S rRNA (adenine(2503)-C(2))-methyltransferase RlmN [Lachnospiraceae bacterium]|nr:23S rRNA (adenine(2503)-C(2))-methyltransferase RlmN [Lachnospiraceae bacterium]
MKDLKELTLEELKAELTSMGEPAFRAKQLYSWIHQKLSVSVEEMSNLPLSLRERLGGEYVISAHTIRRMQESAIDGTRKYLFGLADGNSIESVWMRYHHGNSLCISSQVGCRMGCAFCASTIGGRVRNLTAAEMLEQVYAVSRDTGERVDNVVVMGIGEPLDNPEELLRFIRMLTDEQGLHISRRSITVSTCGLVPGIRRLAEEDTGVTLALSLHAPTDEQRRKIMPVAERYRLEELMAAVDYFFEKTGRRVSFEYALIAGVNDRGEDAEALAALAVPRGCHVNLIAVNPVRENGLREPGGTGVRDFQDKLKALGVNATLRRELGRDIDGACGQLRRAEQKIM